MLKLTIQDFHSQFCIQLDICHQLANLKWFPFLNFEVLSWVFQAFLCPFSSAYSPSARRLEGRWTRNWRWGTSPQICVRPGCQCLGLESCQRLWLASFGQLKSHIDCYALRNAQRTYFVLLVFQSNPLGQISNVHHALLWAWLSLLYARLRTKTCLDASPSEH